MKKKIVIATGNLFGGGAERVASVWANELSDCGYDVSILLFSRSDNEYSVCDDVKIIPIAKEIKEYLALSYFQRFKKMRRALKETKSDCVISFLPTMQIWMLFVCFGLKVKRIDTVRLNPWQRKKMLGKKEKILCDICFKTADCIQVQCSEQKEFFSKKLKKKCFIVPNTISQVYINNQKKEYSEVANNFVAAGRIAKQKNYPMMIRAFSDAAKNNKDLTLSIYGTGDEEYINFLKQLVCELGMSERIVFKGRTSALEKEYPKYDAYLMTSDFEGMPNALLEAMASGLICVSTDCRTGPKDLIDDNINGFLVSVNDEKEMSEKITKISNMSRIEREKMGRAAREKVMSLCGRENTVKRLCDMIEKTISKK